MRVATKSDGGPIGSLTEVRIKYSISYSTKSGGPSWGQNDYPENGLVKPPKRGTQALRLA
jgi:hypothetical protein